MPRIKKSKTMEDIIIDYLDNCSYRELSKKTIKSYYQTLMLLKCYLEEEKGITNFNNVTGDIIEEYIEFTKERGKYSYTSTIEGSIKANIEKRGDIGLEISITTLNNYLRNIKAFFSWMEENKLIRNNSVKKCKYIKQVRTSKEQLTDAEFNRLIKSIDITKYHEFRDYTIINLIFDSGMRLGETLNLTIHDIDLVRRTIVIPSEITKGKKERVVFFSESMYKLLSRWIRYKDSIIDTELLFPSQRSNGVLAVTNFERNFRGYLSRAKINKKISPHNLRNNFGRRFLISGGDIFTLSKILGHSSVTVTEKAYADLLDEDLRRKYSRYSPLENLNK